MSDCIYLQVREPVLRSAVTREEAASGVWLEFDHHGELLGVEVENVEVIIRVPDED